MKSYFHQIEARKIIAEAENADRKCRQTGETGISYREISSEIFSRIPELYHVS